MADGECVEDRLQAGLAGGEGGLGGVARRHVPPAIDGPAAASTRAAHSSQHQDPSLRRYRVTTPDTSPDPLSPSIMASADVKSSGWMSSLTGIERISCSL